MRDALIIGGAPSLKLLIPELQSHHTGLAIAVNNSWEIAPWADILFFGDGQWWQWHGERVLQKFQGRIISGAAHCKSGMPASVERRRTSHGQNTDAFRSRPGTVYGLDSGTKAISLAYRLGCSNILLAGLDLQPGPSGETHWHGGHTKPTPPSDWDRFRGPRKALLDFLTSEGVTVSELR